MMTSDTPTIPIGMRVRVRTYEAMVCEFGRRNTGSADCPYGYPRVMADRFAGREGILVQWDRMTGLAAVILDGDTGPTTEPALHTSMLESDGIPLPWQDMMFTLEEFEKAQADGIETYIVSPINTASLTEEQLREMFGHISVDEAVDTVIGRREEIDVLPGKSPVDVIEEAIPGITKAVADAMAVPEGLLRPKAEQKRGILSVIKGGKS